jgi:hypothetical protein
MSAAPPEPEFTLTDADRQMFARFGVGQDLLALAGVRRVTDAEARHHYRINGAGDMSGVIFPYFDPLTRYRVSARLRRDIPEVGVDRKRGRKYVYPYGDNPHLYFPPGADALLSDVSVPLVIVEAEKSSLALTALSARTGRPLLPVATGGCWGWRGKTGIEPGPNGERDQARGPLPDLERITWRGRRANVIFDSDVVTNPKVAAAREAMAKELHSRGARVFLVDLRQE